MWIQYFSVTLLYFVIHFSIWLSYRLVDKQMFYLFLELSSQLTSKKTCVVFGTRLHNISTGLSVLSWAHVGNDSTLRAFDLNFKWINRKSSCSSREHKTGHLMSQMEIYFEPKQEYSPIYWILKILSQTLKTFNFKVKTLTIYSYCQMIWVFISLELNLLFLKRLLFASDLVPTVASHDVINVICHAICYLSLVLDINQEFVHNRSQCFLVWMS